MSEPIVYRRTSPEDVSRLEEMEIENFQENAFGRRQIRYLLQSPNAISLAACSNNKIIGYVIGLGRKGSQTMRIYTFCISKEYRLRGIATSLLKWLEEECMEKGIYYIVLEVSVLNVPAQKFYIKNGFMEFDRIPKYYRDGITAIRMKKLVARPTLAGRIKDRLC